MENLFAPWRMSYILGPKDMDCVFCLSDHPEEDADKFILGRGKLCFVLMNRYPYANGHIMAAPLRHVADLADLTADESAELMFWLQAGLRAVRSALRPDGVNIGLNLGEIAGAGIKNHLHFHLVPRWQGDASFMSVCAQTRVIPETLAETYAKLAPLFTFQKLHQ